MSVNVSEIDNTEFGIIYQEDEVIKDRFKNMLKNSIYKLY